MKKIITALLLLGLIAPSFAFAQGKPADVQELLQKIQQLQAKLKELDAKQQENRVERKEAVQEVRELARTLRQGTEGDDVKVLQALLAADPAIYPEGTISGYYGPKTAQAVKRFQKKHSFEQVGAVGPKTLRKLNELLKEMPLEVHSVSSANASATTVYGQGVSGSASPAPVSAVVCHKVPPGHLIAPGWLKKNNGQAPIVPECQTLPYGIAKKLGTTTPPTLDTSAPVISSLAVGSITNTSAVVTWTTNESATSRVYVGTANPVVASTSNLVSVGGLVTSHSVPLSGLATNTTYYLIAVSSDAVGNTATSSQTSFTTTNTVPTPGTFTGGSDNSMPFAALVVGGTQTKIGAFKFTTSNETFTITELWWNATGSAAITELVLKDGGTVIKTQPFAGTDLKMTGLSFAVPANTNKVLDLYATIAPIGTGNAPAGTNVAVTLYAMKYRNSSNVETTLPGLSLTTNNFYAYKTKPTVSLVALPTTVLTGGTQTVAKFNIATDAAGSVEWNKIAFNLATSTATVTAPVLYDDANQSTSIGTCSLANVATQIVCTNVANGVSGSKTYVIKANIEGPLVTGSSVITTLVSSGLGFAMPSDAGAVSATNATFVWSDQSVIPHSGASADWSSDYLVKNIPTDSQTLTK